jgi:hypothetical protein
MRRRRAVLVLGIAALACAAATAAQALTPVSQERRVSIVGDASSVFFSFHFEDVENAPDFAPFAQTVDNVPIDAAATQDSRIDPDALHATGSFHASAGEGSPNSSIDTDTESVFTVGFDVDASTPFTLSGHVDLSLDGCDAATNGWIHLSGPGGVIADIAPSHSDYGIPFHCPQGCQDSTPVSAYGVMEPGRYTLLVGTHGNTLETSYPQDVCTGALVTGSYAVDLVLTPPPEVPALPGAASLALVAALAAAARIVRR